MRIQIDVAEYLSIRHFYVVHQCINFPPSRVSTRIQFKDILDTSPISVTSNIFSLVFQETLNSKYLGSEHLNTSCIPNITILRKVDQSLSATRRK